MHSNASRVFLPSAMAALDVEMDEPEAQGPALASDDCYTWAKVVSMLFVIQSLTSAASDDRPRRI